MIWSDTPHDDKQSNVEPLDEIAKIDEKIVNTTTPVK